MFETKESSLLKKQDDLMFSFVILHLPFPVRLSFFPTSFVPSRTRMERSDLDRYEAAISPEAPAPIIQTS